MLHPRRLLHLLLFPGLVLIPALASRAQAAQPPEPAVAVLHGVVLDQTRAPIAGAQIYIDGSESPAVASTADGTFEATLLPGRHTILITSPGFLAREKSVDVTSGERGTHAFVLALDALRETVVVSGVADGYQRHTLSSATKTATPLVDVPQAATVVTRELMQDQLMDSIADVVRYVPGVTAHQGENNRDQVIIRGNSSSADFFLDGMRDDLQYYRDVYNLDRVEALKGPNAMIFGRGGGGVINRVTKVAGFTPQREVTVQEGAFGETRLTTDLNHPVSDRVALRLNGVYQHADSFRQSVTLTRGALNPTMTFAATAHTTVTLGFEHAFDARVADRGIPSYQGRPADIDIATYFGDPANSHVDARADLLSAAVHHQRGAWTVRHRTLVGNYDRSYQNFVPGAVTADRSQVALTAYNNATQRTNVLTQTEVVVTGSTGPARHTWLGGGELGRQASDNLRNTGYVNDSASSWLVSFARPSITPPVTFRQSATDADNHVVATVAAAYVQDQVELTQYLRLVGGLRADTFHVAYRDNRTATRLGRTDTLMSPRAGLVLKPVPALSVYGSYTVSHLPSAGDQFASLTVITEQLEPERFTNYEVGIKWDARPGLSVTTAAYQLDRTNTRATAPDDPTRTVQTGSQRTTGYELGVSGRATSSWQVAGGYAFQDARVTSATTAARAGARVAQVPRHTLSLWNTYQVHPRVGLAVGVVQRTDMFATIDNTVVLPGYTETDAALFLRLTPPVRLQANIDNVTNRRYYVNADSNTNISPGAPRTARVAIVVRF